MLSAGGQVPTNTVRARLGERLRDGESEAAVVGDAGDEGAFAGEVDVEHVLLWRGTRDAGSAAGCE